MAPRPHRPLRTDRAVIASVADHLSVTLQSDFSMSKIPEDVLLGNVTAALKLHSDGYDMAKFLELSCGWKSIDGDTVAKLRGSAMLLDQIVRRAERRWVAENNIAPNLRVGDQVEVDGRTGTIRRINAERAMYEFLPDDARSSIFATEVECEYLDAITLRQRANPE